MNDSVLPVYPNGVSLCQQTNAMRVEETLSLQSFRCAHLCQPDSLKSCEVSVPLTVTFCTDACLQPKGAQVCTLRVSVSDV